MRFLTAPLPERAMVVETWILWNDNLGSDCVNFKRGQIWK